MTMTAEDMGGVATGLSEALGVLRRGTGNPALPVQHALIFLAIAAHRGRKCVAKDLESITGMTRASISRAIESLGRGPVGGTGAGLVDSRENPMNRSYKLLTLTEKGQRTMVTMSCIIKDAVGKTVIPAPLRPYLDLRGMQR